MTQETIDKVVELVNRYEQWEAEVIMDDRCWPWDHSMALTPDLYQKLIDLQALRNEVKRRLVMEGQEWQQEMSGC